MGWIIKDSWSYDGSTGDWLTQPLQANGWTRPQPNIQLVPNHHPSQLKAGGRGPLLTDEPQFRAQRQKFLAPDTHSFSTYSGSFKAEMLLFDSVLLTADNFNFNLIRTSLYDSSVYLSSTLQMDGISICCAIPFGVDNVSKTK